MPIVSAECVVVACDQVDWRRWTWRKGILGTTRCIGYWALLNHIENVLEVMHQKGRLWPYHRHPQGEHNTCTTSWECVGHCQGTQVHPCQEDWQVTCIVQCSDVCIAHCSLSPDAVVLATKPKERWVLAKFDHAQQYISHTCTAKDVDLVSWWIWIR